MLQDFPHHHGDDDDDNYDDVVSPRGRGLHDLDERI